MDHITGQGLLAIKRHEGTPRRLWVTTPGGLLKLDHGPTLFDKNQRRRNIVRFMFARVF